MFTTDFSDLERPKTPAPCPTISNSNLKYDNRAYTLLIVRSTKGSGHYENYEI